jgi:hypothetical protein
LIHGVVFNENLPRLNQIASMMCRHMLDIRGPDYNHCHTPDDWPIAQRFAQGAKDRGENGLWYQSLRNPPGECVAAFRTLEVEPVTQGTHYRFNWNGYTIDNVFEITEIS